MSDFTQKLALAAVTAVVGVGLVLFSVFVTHQTLWLAAGIFFGVVGLAAGALTFAPTAPGPVGVFLRSPGVSVLLLTAVGASLCYTLLAAVFPR
jgi:hypothetical protein